MSSISIEGYIKKIGAEQSFGANNFRKREFVVTTDEQYPQDLLIEFVQDKCSILDKYMEGEKVKVSINLRGKEWINQQGESRYFNSFQAWKIEKIFDQQENDRPQSAVDQYEQQHQQDPEDDLPEEDPEDDLPF